MYIITGASDGLGLELAHQTLSIGKKVISLSRSKPPEGIVWIKTDLTNEESINQAVLSIMNLESPLTALINCAAITSYEDIAALTSTELNRMFSTNVTGPMLLISKLYPRLKFDGTDIINIGATIALKSGYANQSVYSTTKWALRGFSTNLRSDLKNSSCRVIDVYLGGFNSQMHEKVTGNPISDPENWMDPKDIAECILQLLYLPKLMEVSEITINRKTGR